MTRLPDDTRGIVAPSSMVRHVDLVRYPASGPLEGLVDWFWSVQYVLAVGVVHRQDLVPQPGINVSVGTAPPAGPTPPPGPYPLRAVVNGVATHRTSRVLTGEGWNVAAKTTTGGFGAWVDDVAALNDRAVPIGDVLDVDEATLVRQCRDASLDDVVAVLVQLLVGLLERRDPARIDLAREVARVASIAEGDRDVRRVGQLAALAGVTTRTLQRMFASCVGVTPTWVIRRYRLLDAAERVREGQIVDWAGIASELGYADQAHLVRDFSTTIGHSPAAYAQRCRLR